MVRRAFLLVLLVPIIAACGSKVAKEDQIGIGGPMRELFPPEASAPPAPAAAGQATTSENSQVAPAQSNPAPPDTTTWPITVSGEGVTFQVHEPVVNAWDDRVLTAHSLVLAQPAGQQQPVTGTVVMRAATQVDRPAGLVLLRQSQVLDANFPAARDRTQIWLALLRATLPEKMKTVALARLESGRTVVEARQRAASGASVAAPRIIIAQKPAVLVYIDEDPRYMPLKGTKLVGVVNTRVLLLKDPSGRHYLHLYNGWVSAASLQGPWTIAKPPPGAIDLEQKARATDRANLLLGKPDANGHSPTLSKGNLPQIIVSTKPAALIVLDGAPRFARIPGTALEYATNTSAHLLREVDSKSVYVRVGGYWFHAGAMTGPWNYVPVASLPAAFSAIPDDSPKRNVKTSIVRAQAPAPATASASTIVAVDPKSAKLFYTMSGDPVLKPIPGTELNYVANTSVPMIQVDINNWYAVQSGVWFFAKDATGPWTVTKDVPPQIYAIPPTVPIYSAIHSRAISSSTDVIYYDYPSGDSVLSEGGAVGVEDQGSDYQYTPPSNLYWGWVY